jgi:hypothetical protein
MRTLQLVAIYALLTGNTQALASDCQVSYQPDSQLALLPCVRVASGETVYDVTMMQIAGLDFRVIGFSELSLGDAQISEVAVITDPIPVVLAFVQLTDSCSQLYDPAQVAVDAVAQTIDIDIKVIPPGIDELCLAATRTEVRSFGFDELGFEPGGTTYLVDVNGIATSFVYDPLAP